MRFAFCILAGACLSAVLVGAGVQTVNAQTPSIPATTDSAPLWTERVLLQSTPPGPYRVRTTVTPRTVSGPHVAAVFHLNYNSVTHAGFVRGDGSDAAVIHPRQKDSYGYLSPGWCRNSLAEMYGSGVDTMLVAWWTTPYMVPDPQQWHRWTWYGMKAMIASAQARQKKGLPTPRFAPRIEGGALEGKNAAGYNVDLQTPAGRAWLYTMVRDFYSLVPPALRATDKTGRPLVTLTPLPACPPQGFSPDVLNYLRLRWAEDFGEPALCVATLAPEQFPNADLASYPAVTNGRAGTGDMSVIRPGTVSGGDSMDEPRQNGTLYKTRWEGLLGQNPARRPDWVVLNSWNNWQTGTAIAPSRELGTRDLEQTRRFTTLLRAKRQLPPRTAFTGASAVSVSFTDASAPLSRGLTPVVVSDGPLRPAQVGGSACLEVLPGSFLYLNVDDGFFFDNEGLISVTLEYWDEGTGSASPQYDSTSRNIPDQQGAYKQALPIAFTNTKMWKTHTFVLSDARFVGRENGGADMRFSVSPGSSPLRVRLVSLSRQRVP